MTNMEEDDKNDEESTVIFSTHVQNTTNNNCNNQASSITTTPEGRVVLEICSGCQCPIYDKYYMWVDKRSWHEHCVKCTACGRPLMASCYTKNRKLYCDQDYKQLQKCRRCHHLISLDEFVLQVGGLPYHVQCFVCDFCHRQLRSGDHYFVDERTNQIVCKTCYTYPINSHNIPDENSISDSERSDDEVFPNQSMHGLGHMTNYVHHGGLSSQHGLLRTKNGSKSTSALAMMGTTSDGKRVKRPRTILTTAQRRKFKASFEVSQKPCRKVRETLAAETGLSARVVQVWFQNQRAKMKKLARRQQSDGSGLGGSRSGSRSRRKRTTDSDSDNEVLSSPGSSISTPLQNQLFSDAYRSPGSLQTSPTTSTSEVNPYFQPAPPPNHDLPDMVEFSEFENNMFTSSDVYMTQSQNIVTSSENDAALSTDVRLHAGLHQPMDSFGNPRVSMVIEGDHVATSPIDNFQTFGAGQQHMPPRFSAQGHDKTPMDSLMCMPSNYFRT